MWAASFYWQFTPYQFGNCPSFPFGNFNGMAPFVNYMGFPSANMFTSGSVFNPYAMCPGNFLPFPPVPPSKFNVGYGQNFKQDHPRSLKASPARKVKAVSPVPPCNFDAGYYQNYKGDHPPRLNASPTRKVKAVSPALPCNFNDDHSRTYKVDRSGSLSANLPRNAASQRLFRPSVSQFCENPKQYQGFVLVMVISTGKLEVLTWREAIEKGKQVKISPTPSELRSGKTSLFRP